MWSGIRLMWCLGRREIYFESSMQDFSNSISNALKLLQSCVKPSVWCPSLWLTVPIAILHYSDVIMSAMFLDCLLRRRSKKTSKLRVTGLCEGQSSVSLVFVRGIHRWPVNSPHKGPVTRETFPFNEVILARLEIVPHWACSCTRRTDYSAWPMSFPVFGHRLFCVKNILRIHWKIWFS